MFRASSDTIDIIVTPEAPVIETAYYLVGDMNAWLEANLIKFNHSGKDVYEDPYFTVIVKVPANCYWKIIPQSNVDAGNVWARITSYNVCYTKLLRITMALKVWLTLCQW